MLGGFAVYRGETLIAESAWQRQKAKKLFKLLVLAPQYRLHKDRVLECLWPAKSSGNAANNLNRTLFILRRVLQPDLASASQSSYIALKDDVLTLTPTAVGWVDVEAFEQLIQLGGQQHHNLDSYNAALELYQGELLPENVYDDWANQRRNSLHKSYVDLLRLVSSLYAERANFQQAVSTLLTLLRVEPTDEGTQRQLMQLYAHTGERDKAIRLYRQSRQALLDELGVEPSLETAAVYEAILAETLPPAFSPLPTNNSGSAFRPEEPNRTPWIGRRAETERLTEYLRQAQRGQGNVVFLVGEQGVGKTRLAEELMVTAQAIGVRVLQGTAFDGEGRLLYTPFVSTLRRGLSPRLIEQARQRLGTLVGDLARLLPELAKTVPLANDALDSVPSRLNIGTGDQDRRRLFDAILGVYTVMAQTTPLLVFLDNLHAAGESSLQLLHYLARQISYQRILFLCAVDQDKLQAGTPIAFVWGELKRNYLAQCLNLRRLTRDEVTQFCAGLLGASVGDSAIPGAIFDLTEGNPFFIKELVFSLTQRGQIEQNEGVWRLSPESKAIVPPSVNDVVRLRLGHLSEDAQRLLGVAAVSGTSFNYELLHKATQWERSRLLDAFEALLQNAVIEATDTGYRFQHAMIRQSVYNELSTERRAWLHEQVAQALELLLAGRLDEHAAILAYHYEHAGQPVLAVRYLLLAGDWARRAYASREALEHFNQAFELCRRHVDIAGPDTFVALLERRSQTFLILSDFDSAIGDLEQLLTTYQNAGDQTRVGETLYHIGFAHYWAHRLMKAAMFLDQALNTAEALDYDELRNRVLRLRDILNSTQGSVVDSATSETTGSDGGPPLMQAEAHWGSAMLAHLRYDFEAAQRHAQSCIDVGASLSNTFLTLGGYFILGMSQASLGNYQTALDSLLGALKLSQATGDHFWRARLMNTVGWIYRDLFSLDLAVQYDRESLALARASTPRLTEAEGNALANLTTNCLLLEQYDLARAYLAEGLALSVTEPFMRWRYFTRLLVAQGELALVDGNLSQAMSAADKSLDLARHTKARKNISRSCSLRGKIHLASGQLDKARLAMNHALGIAHELKNPGLIWPCHLALAELEDADADRRPEAAQLHYATALAVIERIVARLADTSLQRNFLTAAPIRKVYDRAPAPESGSARQGASNANVRVPL
jgi:DNA-binding SARP family transcriptional activator